MFEGMINKALAAVLGGKPKAPPLPPAPTEIRSGNATIDEAIRLMPLEHRERLRQLLEGKRVNISRASIAQQPKPPGWRIPMALPPTHEFALRGQYAHGPDTMFINSEMMRMPLKDIAETLTHESQHALQRDAGGVVRNDLRPSFIKGGDPYRDSPQEVEARLAQQLVRDVSRKPGR